MEKVKNLIVIFCLSSSLILLLMIAFDLNEVINEKYYVKNRVYVKEACFSKLVYGRGESYVYEIDGDLKVFKVTEPYYIIDSYPKNSGCYSLYYFKGVLGTLYILSDEYLKGIEEN